MSSPNPPAPLVPPKPGYEFHRDENDIISRLARSQRALGQTLTLLGLVAVAAGLVFGYAFFAKLKPLPNQTEEARHEQLVNTARYRLAPGVLLFVSGLVLLPLGYWNLRAAHAFRTIVETTGRDIPQLMIALTALGRVYRLSFGLMIAPAAIALVLLAVYTYDLFQP